MSLLEMLDRPLPRRASQPVDAALEAFKELVDQGKYRKFSMFVEITPSIANYLLQKNPDNRNQKRYKINEIKADILAGTYECNGEAIIISSCGFVNDGQNRLQSVFETGGSILSNVAFGLPRATRMSVDSNQTSRSAADYLQMEGVGHSQDVANIGSVLRVIENTGSYAGTKGQAAKHTHEYASEHLDEIEAAMRVVTKAGARMVLNYQTACAMFVLFSRAAGHDLATQFMTRLLNGAGLASSSPIFVLRERLIREKHNNKSGGRRLLNDMMELTIRAWNHWRAGTSATRMQVMGVWPEISR